MSETASIYDQDKQKTFLSKVTILIFGEKRPDVYTFSAFLLNLIIGLIFTIWEILSLIAITSRELIWTKKGISVEAIINQRGEALGFPHGKFIEYLQTVHSIGLILWLVFLVGTVFIYRKSLTFIYLTTIPIVLFVGMLIFYLNFQYFLEDTTTFDKLALLVSLLSLLIHYFLLRLEKTNGKINFFGLNEDEESEEDPE